jgi:protein TonB
MVPPDEIDLNAPTTLPADFGEWDSGEDSAAQSTNPPGFDGFPGSGAALRPVAKPVTARVAVLPVADRPAVQAAPRRSATAYAAAEQVYQPPQHQHQHTYAATDQEYMAESPSKPKGKVMYIAVGSVAALLVLGGLGYSHMRSGTSTPKPTVAPTTTMVVNPQKPTPSTPSTTTSAPETTTTDTTETERPLRAQSDAMNHQLNAPSRIPSDLKMLAGKEAPTSGFGTSGMDNMGSGSVFSGQSGPKVKVAAPTRVSVSAGVAVGLLMQKTAPAYPPLAKSAHVSGTVVIQATINKNGSVVNPRVVSGPTMLRQAAVDAVKSWRYRPYLLNGEPVEVETTVNVVFALGG